MSDRTWNDEYVESDDLIALDGDENDYGIHYVDISSEDSDDDEEDDELAIAFALFLAGDEDDDWEPDSWDDDGPESGAEWDE